METGSVRISLHARPRGPLWPLFRLADDSDRAIAQYLDLGWVHVAEADGEVVGHAQLLSPGESGVWELRSLAVLPAHRGRGIGRALVHAALAHARARGATRVSVATATADVGNLRFYQRLGFRLVRIEADVFTVEAGYPAELSSDGIPVRDRVWLELSLEES